MKGGKPIAGHGTRGRYHHHRCRCQPCREAARIYAKRMRERRLASAYTDPTGTVRRVQGLVAYGYSLAAIGREFGAVTGESTRQLARNDGAPVLVRTAKRIAALCDRLARLDPPTGQPAVRARNDAARNGWLPLHAWDDIDDPDAVPNLGGDGRDIIDEVAIRRVVDGHARYGDLTLPERKHLVRTYADRIPNLAQKIGMSGGQLKKWVAEFEAAA